MQRRIFWMVFLGLSIVTDLFLPLAWGLIATVPIIAVSWWVAYRSDWF
jgi:hypothetical protein